ncbi:MAG: hypothetical protein IKL84_09175 [Clostridia bacterium]|nr:hypothetical protein [Clostridia bacterium]
MKLCEHIAEIYRNEIKHGNRPIYVSTPQYVDRHASAKLYVIMKKRLQDYHASGIEERHYTDYHFPRERFFCCTACGHCISGPLDENQSDWFEDTAAKQPHDKVHATDSNIYSNIYIEEGVYGKHMIPDFSSK